MIWLVFLLGVATPFLVTAVVIAVVWALSPGFGSDGCLVCEHGPNASIGERRQLTMKVWMLWHQYVWSYRKWHRQEFAAHSWGRDQHTPPAGAASTEDER